MKALDDLRDERRKRLKALSKAERLRRKRKGRAKQLQKFYEDPFAFTKALFNPVKSGELKATRDELQNHLRNTYSDNMRNLPLPPMEALVRPTSPGENFDTHPPRLSEVERFVKKARAGSSPGPNGVPYKVFKYCTRMRRLLWRLLRVLWRNNVVPKEWSKAEGVYIPKEKNAERIETFRPISLLNIDGKIMMGILAGRLSKYLLVNGFIDTAVQKAGVPGFSGCVEHSAMIWHTIQEAKRRKMDLSVLWLDLANAYGSLPHSMIWFTLDFFYIPDKLSEFLKCYFQDFKMRFSTKEFTTAYQPLEVGIPMGCAISPILFVMAIEVITRAACSSCRGIEIEPGLELPPIRAFMDDLTLLNPCTTDAQKALERLDQLISWCRMKFKPKKSRSLTIRKGRVDDRTRYRVGGEAIPSISDAPVKSLGRWFTKELSDKNQIIEIRTMVEDGLKRIDRCTLPNKLKLWCLKFGLFPRIMWPLMLYEIAMTHVERMEQRISVHVRKWLGVPPCTTNISFYGHSTKLKLPLSALTEEFKVKKAHMFSTLRDSSDQFVKGTVPDIRTGRKWNAQQEVEDMESRLRHKDMVGPTQTNRAGLGMNPTQYFFKATTKMKRKMVSDEIRRKEEEHRIAKAVGLVQQGAWCRWECVEPRSLSWRDIWKMETGTLKFLLRATYDVLPSPHNLKKWAKTENENCHKCGKKGSLRHILSNCQVSLVEGLYTWRHNEILKVLSNAVKTAVDKSNMTKSPNVPVMIPFVKAGTNTGTNRKARPHTSRLLGLARDWQLVSDLTEQMTFPSEIAITNMRPDLVVWSKQSKSVVLCELTVPWEENIEIAHEYKTSKYTGLISECKERGWKVNYHPVEVGCRGYATKSLLTFLSRIGVTNRKKLAGDLTETATRSSAWIWSRYKASLPKEQLKVASYPDAAGPPPAT